ncbi:MAG: hypothetical protein CM15mP62_08620 [Rhodospirillaceae bacterium]|nr:MAG: hypothetical protein CM15mP62_08620 [Rhodospirillaceae bacterium]
MLMLSNGGLTNTSEAKHRPVDLLESGPAGGALSAALIGKLQNEERLIAFDMGGTTAKIAIIDNGQPEFRILSKQQGRDVLHQEVAYQCE